MKEINFITKDVNSGENKTRLTIKGDGKIGIGLIDPDYTLDISGDLNISGTVYKNGINLNNLSIKNIGDVNYTIIALIWDESNGVWVAGAPPGLWQKNSDNDIFNSENNIAIGLDAVGSWTDGGITGEYRQDISGNAHVSQQLLVGGKLGIGTDQPQYNLHVNGSTMVSTSWSTSDDRVKHNEGSILNALSTILKLEPKHYLKTIKLYDASHQFMIDTSGIPLDVNGERLKEYDEYNRETGLIAQKIQEIPELQFTVRVGEGDEIPLAVDYNSIHCTHLAATKELYSNYKTLEQETVILQNDNVEIKQDIEGIKQGLGI
jgi:hypothetical protein